MTTTFHGFGSRVMVTSESIAGGNVIAIDIEDWLPEPAPEESPQYFVWPAMEVVGVETTG